MTDVRLDAAEHGVMLVHVGDCPPTWSELRALVSDTRAGAIVTFEGVTRTVDALDYEAYAQMAAEQISEISIKAIEQHGACRVAVSHMTGTVPLGESSVIILASSAHRDAAFLTARQVIDDIKRLAPIWKVEIEGNIRTTTSGTVPVPEAS